ncbi:hypothetical protein GIB67_040605 [Kingdonia uniflora]|uniref:Uncharacterized protein n=1 Tax=Kingdonia uniflora TaxID=39325 RepID=A0A7J7M916_9MAGN|nr:hypothetical protein GIB67_040605 [Kingdonia uniflora]
MMSSPVSGASTTGRSVEYEIRTSGSEEEVGADQFSGFPGRLVSHPLHSEVFKELRKARASLGGRWGNCIDYVGRQFRGCTVATGEEYFYLLAHLAKEKKDRGIEELISLEYFNEDVQTVLLEGRPWNDNVIWVKGDCLQRDDEEPMELLFRTVKQSPKSQVTRKESLLDTVAQVETKLEAVLEDLGISRKKCVNSRVNKVLKSQSTRLMTSADSNKKRGTDGERKMLKRPSASGATGSEVEKIARLAALHGEEVMNRMAAWLMKGICLEVEDERAELKRKKVELKRNIARLKYDLSKEEKRLEALKASQVIEINKL